MNDRADYRDQNGEIYDIVCDAKLDSLVKSLTDDPKLVRNIREYAAKNITCEMKDGLNYVDKRAFYCFIYERYLKKYPKLEEKIPKEHQVRRIYFASLGIEHAIRGADYKEEYKRFSRLYFELLKENAALKIKADKWDSFCAKSGKKKSGNPTEKT